ncbi:MAG: pyridoxamine 5'-phosphate oxidase family protein [Gluconacetobacter diazotrophicus]|nr:pyridoxamine 5'-phosphate oxidase family protein [Gluconacetobacter diazotrophicus]
MDTPFSFLDAGLATLERALVERGNDMRNVQLASLAADGGPELRTLVLRGFTREPAEAELHSDARAGKVEEIARDGRVALLAWSAEARLQLRFSGTARLHRNDPVARARWDSLSEGGRRPYGFRARPGTPIADPRDQPHLAEEQRFERFAVILVALDTVDALRLGEHGEQWRAAGRFGTAELGARWVGA